MMNTKNYKNIKIKHLIPTKWNWVVSYPENLRIGKFTDIGCFTYIQAEYGVVIGAHVEIGAHGLIYSHSTIDNRYGMVIIGDNVCIGAHSTIMPGVCIGSGAIIGAYSFVKTDIPENCLAFGCPAKVIKRRYKKCKERCYFYLPTEQIAIHSRH